MSELSYEQFQLEERIRKLENTLDNLIKLVVKHEERLQALESEWGRRWFTEKTDTKGE